MLIQAMSVLLRPSFLQYTIYMFLTFTCVPALSTVLYAFAMLITHVPLERLPMQTVN